MKHAWINPTGDKSKVVILTDEAILLSNPSPSMLREFSAALERGEVLTALLADEMQVIPLASVQRLQSDRERSQIRIVHGFGVKPSTSLAQFDELGTRDNAFESLRQALGQGFSVAQRETGQLKSGWKPLVKALAVAIMAFMLRRSESEAASGEQLSAPQEGWIIFEPAAITLMAICMIAYYLREFYRRTQELSPHLELVRD